MVQKKSGRPRRFDPDTALNAAVEVFWQKGFAGASLDDLTKALGINRPSLYATFGDKRKLFLASVERYARDFSGKAIEAFLAEPDLQRAVERFFETALSTATREGGLATGCLVGSSSLSAFDDVEGLDDMIARLSTNARARIAQRLEAEKTTGALPGDFPSQRRAALMIELMQGQAHRARLGEARADIAKGLPDRVNAVLSGALPGSA